MKEQLICRQTSKRKTTRDNRRHSRKPSWHHSVCSDPQTRLQTLTQHTYPSQPRPSSERPKGKIGLDSRLNSQHLLFVCMLVCCLFLYLFVLPVTCRPLSSIPLASLHSYLYPAISTLYLTHSASFSFFHDPPPSYPHLVVS